jgi:hypothetical protein
MATAVSALLCAVVLAMLCASDSGAVTRTPLALLPSTDLNPSTLTRVDPTALRPVGRRVALVQADAPALSPDRSEAVSASAAVAALSFVDVVHMRRLRRSIVVSNSATGLSALAWPSRRKVLALTTGSNPLVLVYDTVERRVTRRYRLSGIVDAVARTRTGLAVVLSRRGRIAPARLALVAGRVRTVRLARILAGWHNNKGPGSPLLAIEGQHMYVSATNGVTADVEVPPLRVRYHALGKQAQLARRSVALPGRRLALVSDFDVFVVDTRSWRTFGSVPAEQRLCWVGGPMIFCANQNNLEVFDLTGAERFRVHTPTPAVGSEVVGTHAFLSYEQGARYGILNLASGKLKEVHAPLPTVIPGQRGVQRGTVP